MAATNREMPEEVASGTFRKDLYYRLGVVSLIVPPLRDRKEDIAELVLSYLDYLRPRVGTDVHKIADEALAAMVEYDWPGNVRELINVVERAMLLCADEEIGLVDLPDSISGVSAAARSVADLGVSACPEELLTESLADGRARVVEQFERAYLSALLRDARGRIGVTASRAGITSRSLYDKMRRYGLRKEDFKI
jgi:DNA-binding NtrC family response regulator